LNPKISFNTSSKVLAAVVLLEGAALAANARQIDLQRVGTFMQGTVMLAGVQLLFLGLIALLAFILPGSLFKGRVELNRLMSWLPFITGAIVLIEGLVVITYSSPLSVNGIGSMRSFVPAAFGAQLFFLGAGLVVLRLFSTRDSLKVMFRLAVFLVLASVGLFIIGIADQAFVTGIGGVAKGTLQIGGLQLSALALVGVVLMWLEGYPFMQQKVKGHRLGMLSVMGVATVICLEGMILAGYAAPFSIEGIGGMLERTMMAAGLGLTVVGLLIPASYYFFEKTDYDARKMASSTCLLLVFLLPFSLLI
jgi:hypothetical protein